MKHIKAIIIAFVTLLITISISAQQQNSNQTELPQAIELKSQADTLQYALGAFIGQWIIKNGFVISDPVLFNRGVQDVFQNRPLAVSDTTIVERIATHQLTTQNERSRQMEEQLFAELKGKPGVGALPNGVHYLIIKPGTGIRPAANDSIMINAVGVFPDGTLFEDTFQKEQPINNVSSKLIPGLNEAIQLMPEGSTWRIFVPSDLAYGPAGLPNLVPPYTALIFDITLEKVKRD